MNPPIPNKIELRIKSKTIVIGYPDGQEYQLSAEYLRVYSPSAEVRGHGLGQAKLQIGKIAVGISQIEPVGNYGLKFNFDDGHNTGIYTWEYLLDLCVNQDHHWQNYLQRLKQAGASREQ
jgi:DUF971 family protein